MDSMVLRVFKVITVVMSLFMLMPAEKVSLPFGLILLAGLFTLTWFLPVALLIAGGGLYLIASAGNGYHSRRDDLISIFLIVSVLVGLCFRFDKRFLFEAPFIQALSWIAFIIPAVSTIVLSLIRLQKRGR